MFRPAAHAEAFLHLKVQSLFKWFFFKCFRFGFNDKTEHLPALAKTSPRNNQQMVSFSQTEERSLVATPPDKNTWLDAFMCCRKRHIRETPVRDYGTNTFHLFLFWRQKINSLIYLNASPGLSHLMCIWRFLWV